MTTEISSHDFIYSSLIDDPDLADLVEMFAEELPAKVESLEAARLANDRELFQRLAHQLKGSAGSYGFAAISAAAGKLEASSKSAGGEEQVASLLNSLAQLCGRVRVGSPE